MLCQGLQQFTLYKAVKGFTEVLTCPLAVRLCELFDICGFDIFLAHRDVKEQKVNSTNQKGVLPPVTLLCEVSREPVNTDLQCPNFETVIVFTIGYRNNLLTNILTQVRTCGSLFVFKFSDF